MTYDFASIAPSFSVTPVLDTGVHGTFCLFGGWDPAIKSRDDRGGEEDL